METSIILHDVKNELIKKINDSGVNPCIMRYIIKEIYDLVCEAAEAEYRNAMMASEQTETVTEEAQIEET